MRFLQKKELNKTKRQFLRFIVIGLFSTVINYSVFYGLYEYFDMNYLLASAIGFFAGVLAGYSFNKVWTFSVSDSNKSYIYKYYAVYLMSLMLGLAFLKTLVSIFALSPEIANVLTIGLTTCTNFIGTKLWVFEK